MATQREEHPIYVDWIASLFPEQGKWTEDDYFALPETNQIIELSAGEITMSPYPFPAHQIISDNLQVPLSTFVRQHKLGRVFSAPTSVRLWDGKIRGPDLLFLTTGRFNQIGPQVIHAPVDWVAEIISPGSRKIDSEDKLFEYAQAGISEYWLLDPKANTIQVHVLTGDSYALHASHGQGDTARSVTIPGFEINVDEVFN